MSVIILIIAVLPTDWTELYLNDILIILATLLNKCHLKLLTFIKLTFCNNKVIINCDVAVKCSPEHFI